MNDQQLIALMKQVATALRSGAGLATVAPALLMTVPAKLRPALQRALGGGDVLSETLARVGLIDEAERALLAAGEQGGRLPETLDALARTIEERRSARLKLAASLAYPALLVALAGFLLTAPLAVTRGVGAWLSVAVWPAAFVLAAVIGFFVVWPRLPRSSPLRLAPARIGAALPIVGPQLVRGSLASFLDVLGQLVGAGLPYTLALPAALNASGHPTLWGAERTVMDAIARGATLTEALRGARALPETMLGSIHAAETAGAVPKTLVALARLERDAHRRFVLGSAVAIGMLAFAVVAGAIGVSIVLGGQAYVEQIENIADEAER
jgi:type IV pilus assembly protein PilC